MYSVSKVCLSNSQGKLIMFSLAPLSPPLPPPPPSPSRPKKKKKKKKLEEGGTLMFQTVCCDYT